MSTKCSVETDITPKKMVTIAEESGIDSSSSNHTALEEIGKTLY